MSIQWAIPNFKLPNITLLDNTNYHVWDPEGATHLDTANVWKVINGMEIKPATTDAVATANYLLKQKYGKFLLHSMVSQDKKTIITQTATATEA